MTPMRAVARGAESPGNDQAEYTPTGILPDDVNGGLRNLIDRRDGDTSQALELLYRDNFNLRERLRAARPGRCWDQRVVDVADADALTAYRELGRSTHCASRCRIWMICAACGAG